MTPVEIFKPYYAESIARYIMSHIRLNKEFSINEHNLLKITEIGGGNGTCAKGILDYVRDHHPDVYKYIRYEIIDVSKPFHEIQKKNLADHSSKIDLVNKRYAITSLQGYLIKLDQYI